MPNDPNDSRSYEKWMNDMATDDKKITQRTAAKVHVEKQTGGAGGRSVCRYSSRPSRRVRLLAVADFLEQPKETQCSECLRAVAPLGTIRAQVSAGQWRNIPIRSETMHNAELCGGPSGPSERAPG